MSKTITIKERVYADLIKVKKDDESFSDLFERLITSASPLEILAKIHGSVEFKNRSKMISDINSKRAEMRV